MSISAMKQALDLLETSWGDGHEDTLKYWNETAQVLRQAIAEAEKPWVKSYCGGKPNYTTPIHASDISQERVDETAKSEYEFECPRCGHCCQQKEWVGLTDEEISNLFFDGDSSLGVKTMSASDVWRIKMTENLLREKNVPQS